MKFRQLITAWRRRGRPVEVCPPAEAPASSSSAPAAGARFDAWDCVALVGVALVLAGAWQLNPPAAQILAGLGLLVVGVRNGGE